MKRENFLLDDEIDDDHGDDVDDDDDKGDDRRDDREWQNRESIILYRIRFLDTAFSRDFRIKFDFNFDEPRKRVSKRGKFEMVFLPMVITGEIVVASVVFDVIGVVLVVVIDVDDVVVDVIVVITSVDEDSDNPLEEFDLWGRPPPIVVPFICPPPINVSFILASKNVLWSRFWR